MSQRKGKSPSLSTSNDRDSRQAICQDCHRFSDRMQNIHLWKKHILTIINHLMGWPEAFPRPDKSADAIVSTFIIQHLPVHMCSRYILSDNSTEFKNTLMDQVLKQLGIKRIFSAPYHPQSNGKLEIFHKYLKPTLKK